ncbi:MAG: hypothetical protein EON59_03300 [Alphaproteobacteria bacterium]|nr:MAG: hypothetical protein EON59_03300 [Alphaproteobacteria bacterium]
MRLHPIFCPPVMPGETPASYCSFVAATTGRDARRLAHCIGTSFQGIVDGDPASLAVLTGACGIDPHVFDHTTLALVGPRKFALAGQEFLAVYLTRARQYACPACILQQGPRGQARWQLESYRVCLEHKCMTVPLAIDGDLHYAHDFSHHASNARHLVTGDLQAMPEGTGGLAEYLDRRLAGEESEGWLATMPAYAAARSCEFVGLAMINGVHASWRDATDLDRHVAGAVGYSLLKDGVPAVMEFFREVRGNASDQEFGLRKVYGRIFDFLSHDNLSAGYEPLRSLLREHLLNTVALSEGDVVLGKKVTQRRYHSIRSYSVETGLDARQVRRRWNALGLIREGHAELPNDRVLVEVEHNAATLAAIPMLLERPDAERHLGLTHYQGYGLDPSLIVPYKADGLTSVQHLFHRSDLDAYLENLTRDARPLGEDEEGYFRIGKAAQRCKIQPLAVLQMLLAGKLQNVRLMPGMKGIAAIMVDVAEVRSISTRVVERVSLLGLRHLLGCSQYVANALVKSGVLKSAMDRHPRNNTRCRMVRLEAVDAFDAEFVSLFKLAAQVGRHPRGLRTTLTAMKFEAAFPQAKTGTLFFSRKALQPILHQLRG